MSGPESREACEERARFFAKVLITQGGCWTWIGSLNGGGYGSFWDGRRNVRAHRWTYENLVGPIPDRWQIDHLCRNRSCCNPDHLEAVTQSENTRRGLTPARNRQRAAARTTCRHGHEFTPDNTLIYPSSARHCLTCMTERLAERRANEERFLCPECGHVLKACFGMVRHLRRLHGLNYTTQEVRARIELLPAEEEAA